MKVTTINSDITLSETLPFAFYKSKELFDAMRERVFATSRQLVPGGSR